MTEEDKKASVRPSFSLGGGHKDHLSLIGEGMRSFINPSRNLRWSRCVVSAFSFSPLPFEQDVRGPGDLQRERLGQREGQEDEQGNHQTEDGDFRRIEGETTSGKASVISISRIPQTEVHKD